MLNFPFWVTVKSTEPEPGLGLAWGICLIIILLVGIVMIIKGWREK